ncbi:MAG: cupin domain-containing protein [Armatimonadota bacterium]|nr:cupin domain-containing protein [Armatimonadota bacterium]MDR7550466.1 cupin domain-containing protein [Armatimonadota bacterium]
MSEVQHRVLASMPAEAVNPKMTRRMLWGERLMAALLEFKAGAVVPVHQHEHEQLTYCISGTMRFTIDGRDLVVRGGEVVLIPGHVPHGAEMLDDVVEMDVFSPPRQDWISGADAYLRK